MSLPFEITRMYPSTRPPPKRQLVEQSIEDIDDISPFGGVLGVDIGPSQAKTF
jgi:hypothetical protein